MSSIHKKENKAIIDGYEKSKHKKESIALQTCSIVLKGHTQEADIVLLTRGVSHIQLINSSKAWKKG